MNYDFLFDTWPEEIGAGHTFGEQYCTVGHMYNTAVNAGLAKPSFNPTFAMQEVARVYSLSEEDVWLLTIRNDVLKVTPSERSKVMHDSVMGLLNR